MAANLTPAQRDEYGKRAYALSLKGWRAPDIGAELGISERAVDRLLAKERAGVRASRSETQQADDLADYTNGKKAVIAEAWKRLEMVDAAERVSPSYLDTVSAALDGIAKAHGLFVDRKGLVDQNNELIDPIAALRTLLGVGTEG